MKLYRPPEYIEGPWYRQVRDPHLGSLYDAFYSLIWHAMTKLDWEHEIAPLLKLGALHGNRIANYEEQDAYLLPHVITLDPLKVRTGKDAAEYIVHEVVHAWQAHLGYTLVDNKHEENFHEAMAGFGIATKGKSGRHVGFIGDVWENFLEELGQLNLERFLLSDPPEDTVTITIAEVFSCSNCGEDIYLPPGAVVS